VLWNLLRNAVKFTPPSGRITVRGHWTGDASSQSGKNLIIEVADTGIGIEPEALPTIFDAFQQGGREVTRKYGGLGLGLAISKAIVELHGGRLTAESPGRDRGAVFRISLPQRSGMADVAREEPSGAAAPAASSRGLSILLVEDHPDTSRALERLLSRKGHRVTLARTVAGARELFASGEHFDLLMSDLGLPDGSGTDLIRSLPPESRPPAIALSGYGMESDIKKSTDAGFQFHFTKPIDFAVLESAIATIQAQLSS
jgi:two-component system CheB/CheR fusion protein